MEGKKMNNIMNMRNMICLMVVSITLILVAMSWSDDFSGKRYVYVDVKKILKLERDEIVTRDLSEDETKALMLKFKERFNKELKKLESNHVVFSSPKPIAGAEDVTDTLYSEIKGEVIKK